MKRMIDWAHYKENWADYGDYAFTVSLECIVGIMLVVVLVPFGFFSCLVGYSPEIKGDENDKS